MRKRFVPVWRLSRCQDMDAARFVQQEKDWYDGSIRGMDAEIHRILEAIEELGTFDVCEPNQVSARYS